MQILVHMGGDLPADVAVGLARYRYEIFVKQLGWELPSQENSGERDQYDRSDTAYVVARDDFNAICGCARLLPTTRPYLLQEVFPGLLPEDTPPPVSPEVWELSRFAASVFSGLDARYSWAVQPLLAAVMQTAMRLGARRLIGVTFLSMERLFRRIGIHAHRAGHPVLVDGKLVFACWIDIDHQTLSALGIDSALHVA
ncbi:acyl-homoserine-lactone synthase [Caballeronia mineralivorans]|jgi:acyl homoserine lactone synthase|uniref:acyl-homoserine-lactone synthase n=1 Tax=Caballeronia mineralivorans TaxID=2010198 RepID=UPI0023F10A86|nr:acyl-homoserine-lactone synthase [Caballeronia mineralivorans]MDB5787685.1 rhL [Caballeronia mineralivorans]